MNITIRTTLQPGDVGTIVHLHGVLYAREYGFDATFEAYVAGPLAEFVCRGSERERLWLAERGGVIVGCVAIVDAGEQAAQLRWFLVDPSARGVGLGRRLLLEALSFCEQQGYSTVILWTERSLTAAAHLYESVGFRKAREKPGRLWGREVIEERYERATGHA